MVEFTNRTRIFRVLTSLALGVLGSAKLFSLMAPEQAMDWTALVFGTWELLLAFALQVRRSTKVALALTVCTCAGWCLASLFGNEAPCSCMAGLVHDPGPGLRLMTAGLVGLCAVLGGSGESAV